jgi:tRNA threonylcarbamoyladenosine biosynthesis protein TsaE
MRLVQHSATALQTKRWGELLGRRLGPGDVVALFGRLGAGKTCFAQGLARGLGVGDDVVVTSPTFVIAGEYRGRCPFYHIDLYRLSEPRDIEALGLEEYLGGDGVAVIEWAQRAQWLLGPGTIKVWMHWRGGEERTVVIEAPGSHLRDFPGAGGAE